jgi:hypothetical protein
VGNEVGFTSEREGFCHDHIRSDAYKGFSDSKVTELDGVRIWAFVEERSLEVSRPMAHPRELAAGEVFNKGHENGPVGVFMLVVFLGNSEARKELKPVEAKARNARRRSARAALNVLVDDVPVEDAATTRHG